MTPDWTTPFVLSTPWAIRAIEWLFALSAGIQTLEYWRMQSAMQGKGLWVWSIQRQDIPTPWIRHALDHLFTPSMFRVLLLSRLVALVSLAVQGGHLFNIGFYSQKHQK